MGGLIKSRRADRQNDMRLYCGKCHCIKKLYNKNKKTLDKTEPGGYYKMGISVGQITEFLNLQPTVYTGFTVAMYNFQGRELEKKIFQKTGGMKNEHGNIRSNGSEGNDGSQWWR